MDMPSPNKIAPETPLGRALDRAAAEAAPVGRDPSPDPHGGAGGRHPGRPLRFRKIQGGHDRRIFRRPAAPVPVSAVTVATAAMPRYLDGIGTVRAVHQVTVSPELVGRVVKIMFESGAEVKAGDPLVQLNDGPSRPIWRTSRPRRALAEVTLGRTEARRPAICRPADGRSEPERSRRAQRQDRQHPGAHRPEADQGALRRPARHPPDRARPVPQRRRRHRDADRSRPSLCQLHLARAGSQPAHGRPAGRDQRSTPIPAASSRRS